MPDKSTLDMPPSEYLRECVRYDQETGVLTWLIRPLHHFKNAHGMNTFNAKYSGKRSGSLMNGQYMIIRLGGKHYLSHRVIWKLMTGADPVLPIDHKDGNKQNNSWGNLRQATKQENAFNQGTSRRNKTGFKGVSFDKERGKFYSCIRANGRTMSLGRFDSAESAYQAYQIAARRFHGDFANL